MIRKVNVMFYLIVFIATSIGLNLFAFWVFGSLSTKSIVGFCVLALFLTLGAVPQKKQKSEKKRKLERDLLYHDIKMYKRNAARRNQKTSREPF